MGKDLIDGLAEFGMLDEDSPVFSAPYRNRTLSFHALNNRDELGDGVLVPEHRFIAHDQTRDIAIVSGQIERRCDLALVAGIVLVDPGAERDVKPEFARNLRDPLQPLGRRIGAYRLGLSGDGGEIGANPRLGHFPSGRGGALETVV